MKVLFKSPIKAGVVVVVLLFIIVSLTALTSETNTANVAGEVAYATPESVEYYAAEDVYLVTNINGGPFAADGNGFISKIKPDGTVIDLKWINGENKKVTLHAPKGAAVVGDNLFVVDINQVHVFALPSGKQKSSITIEGSTFLNGITPGDGDNVYITDSGYKEGFANSDTDAIYKVSASGDYELIIKDKDMGHPNGIIADGDKLTVVTFGSGELFTVTTKGEKTSLPSPPKGGLDGLLKLEDGRLIMSSWGGSAIYTLNTDNTYTVLMDSLDAPADLGIDTKRNQLLVPLFKQNKVVMLPL